MPQSIKYGIFALTFSVAFTTACTFPIQADESTAIPGAMRAVTQVAKPGPVRTSPWLHEGLRLTYTGKHATIQGAQFKIVPQGGGSIVDQNGNRYDAVRRETSMAGIVVDLDTIAAIDGDNVVIATRSFVYDPLAMNNPPRPAGMSGGMVNYPQRKLSERFVDPAILKPYLTTPAAGITAVRGPVKIQDETFDAVSILYQDANSYTLNVYDLQTGLQLRWTNTTLDPSPAITFRGDVPHGDAHVHIVELTYARDVNVPGGDGPLPDALARSRVIHAQRSTKMLQFPNGQPMRSQEELTISAHGPNWIEFTSADPGVPGKTIKQVSGSAQFLGWWMSPAALARMERGQVLDEDPITRSKTVVSSVDAKSVVVADKSSDVALSMKYDKTTGMLVASRRAGGSPPTESMVTYTAQ